MTLKQETANVLFDLLEELGEIHAGEIARLLLRRNVNLGMRLREALISTLPWIASGDTTRIVMQAGNVMSGATYRMEHVCAHVFRILRITVPTNIAPHFVIGSLQLDGEEQINGNIPAAAFEPAAVGVSIGLPTIGAGQIIRLAVRNMSSEPRGFYAELFGQTSGFRRTGSDLPVRLAGRQIPVEPGSDRPTHSRDDRCFICFRPGLAMCDACGEVYCATHIDEHGGRATCGEHRIARDAGFGEESPTAQLIRGEE